MITRREFLIGAGATAATIALGCAEPKIAPEKAWSLIPSRYKKGIEDAMTLAGDNSTQIIQAINAVRLDPSKLEAMLFTVQETGRRVSQSFSRRGLVHEDFVYDQRIPSEVADAKKVTAQYLTENVYYAFKALADFPWARDVYLRGPRQFFSQILPYRVGTAPLDDLGSFNVHWRRFFMDKTIHDAFRNAKSLKVSYEDIRTNLDKFSGYYTKAKTDKEKVAIIKDIISYLDIDLFHNAENVRYFPRGPQELTMNQILTPE